MNTPQRDRMSAEEWFKKGVAFSEEGKWEEALKAFDRAIELGPQLARSWYGKGVALRELGRHEEALEAYDKALELDPQLAEAGARKGLVLGQLGRYEEALEAFDRVLETEPRHVASWHNKGMALGLLGRHGEALKAFEKALEIDSQLGKTWYNKGVSLGELGRYEEAIEAYDRALEIEPNDTSAWHNKGNALGKLGRHQEAIEAYDRALGIEPNDVPTWGNKGVALSDLGRYQEAIEAYDRALEIEPNEVAAWYNKGNVLDQLRLYEEAIEAYDRALEIQPNDVVVWNNRGGALSGLGRYQEAIEAYDRALEIQPNDMGAWNNRGVALSGLGQYEEAIEAYDRALEIQPNDVGVWNNKGAALSKFGLYEEAIAAFDRALEIQPNEVAVWNNKGAALSELGLYQEAIEAYDRALEIEPNSAYVWYNRASAFGELGRHGEASRAYEKAAQLFGEREEEDNTRRAKGYALLSKGMRDWAQGRFEEMKKPFTSARREFKKLGEDDVAASLGLVSRLTPIERGFLEALAQDSLESTRERLRKLMRPINRLRRAVDKCELEFVKMLLEAKLDCITVLINSLEFEEDDLYQDLTRAEMVFKDHNFPEALKTVNKLKNFVLDLEEYPSLEAIPEDEKERLLLALNPFKFLDGALTEGVISRMPREPYLAEPAERGPEEEPVSLAALHSGPSQSPVTVCVAQIDYQLRPGFPFRLSKPKAVHEKILRVLALARKKDANIVCLPELCMREEWSEEIAEVSRDRVIIAGSYYDARRNTCLVFIEGKKYTVSKMNPSPAEEELVPDEGMVPGKMPRAFQTKFGVLIPSICLDFTREHYRIEKHIRNVGEVHFLFVPSYDDSEDNLRAYHERASRDCQEHDLYVFISNMAKGGGSSAFGLEHNRRLQNLESRGLKPPDQFTYKWAEIEKGKEGVIIATVNVPASGVAPYLKKRRNLVRIELLPLE